MHEAKLAGAPDVEIWGTGAARREFIFADDLADACVFVMQHYDEDAPINLGGGVDISIAELAKTVQNIVGYPGTLRFNADKPDGMPLKALDSSRLAQLGWQPRTPFHEALTLTYQSYRETHS
jgi:GDP-L-fucose synthase